MSFIDQQVQSDRRHKLASGVVMPFMMPAGVLAVTHMMEYPAAISFLICVVVALAALGLDQLLSRLVLRKLTLKQQAIIGAIGWVISVPVLFLVARFYLFK
jgi:hypothetical protein